eukprot:CAMPEP_0179211246 /NCGR_PEP_ID=MMETSP0797-20121207/317_1 /TAXON_ID=47934 /ORGANISM="Dinophysis acuminata, Strain DAEP01" /LENGTH=46 /DNA_ID= /DNA_START= /DNA_END= /DNA_ORIENTATION=
MPPVCERELNSSKCLLIEQEHGLKPKNPLVENHAAGLANLQQNECV